MPDPSPSDLFAAALAEGQSPLLEADPNSVDILTDERLTALFNKPPQETTDDEIAAMARYYRSRRAQFLQLEQQKAQEPPKVKRSAAKPKSVAEVLTAENFDV